VIAGWLSSARRYVLERTVEAMSASLGYSSRTCDIRDKATQLIRSLPAEGPLSRVNGVRTLY
jgi:hypothetical protein